MPSAALTSRGAVLATMYPVPVALRAKYAKTWMAAWVREVSRATLRASLAISGGTSLNFFSEKLLMHRAAVRGIPDRFCPNRSYPYNKDTLITRTPLQQG